MLTIVLHVFSKELLVLIFGTDVIVYIGVWFDGFEKIEVDGYFYGVALIGKIVISIPNGHQIDGVATLGELKICLKLLAQFFKWNTISAKIGKVGFEGCKSISFQDIIGNFYIFGGFLHSLIRHSPHGEFIVQQSVFTLLVFRPFGLCEVKQVFHGIFFTEITHIIRQLLNGGTFVQTHCRAVRRVTYILALSRFDPFVQLVNSRHTIFLIVEFGDELDQIGKSRHILLGELHEETIVIQMLCIGIEMMLKHFADLPDADDVAVVDVLAHIQDHILPVFEGASQLCAQLISQLDYGLVGHSLNVFHDDIQEFLVVFDLPYLQLLLEIGLFFLVGGRRETSERGHYFFLDPFENAFIEGELGLPQGDSLLTSHFKCNEDYINLGLGPPCLLTLGMNKVVQDYVLMESIGKGQYGNVYRAEHRTTGELFAVKVMSVEKFKHTPKLSEFTNNQINILTKISHPNIIRFYEMLRTANNYYLVYEYCNGGTLGDYIKIKKRLSEDDTLKIFYQLRSAFELLNKEKILHRDLKPNNILFHNGVIKVADFGFCKEMLKDEMTQTMVGSPIYMAPEVLKGSVYDNRADIWSLGVILYEMLYGFCPFEESSIPKLINLIDNTLLKFPVDVQISNQIKVLLKRMMTIKYRERITAAELLKYQLDAKESQGVDPGARVSTNTAKSFKEILVFHRKNMTYLAETLDKIANKLDDGNQNLSLACFMVYKVLWSVQKDIGRNSPYWEHIKIPNTDDQWDLIIKNEIAILQPFGQHIRDIIMGLGSSYKLRMELETNYVDFKYFLEVAVSFNEPEDVEIRNCLVNCFLINRHYMLVFEKKIVDFTDFVLAKKSLEEKEDVCKKFAYTRT